MPKFLSDIILEGANDLQFKTLAGALAGKIEQDGDDLILSNAVGDILLGDGSSDVYIGNGTDSIDILFEVSGAISAESGAALTLSGSGGTLALGSSILSDLTVGTNDTGHDVKFYGATSGAYMLWDESEDGALIMHPAGDAGLEIYTVSGTPPTTPQFKVGRNAGEYFGVHTEDRTTHLIHRQDETDSAAMYTSSELWGGGSGNDSWTWKHGTNSGGSLATVMTLDKAGQLTVTGEVEAGSLDINGNADISGTITTATWGGANLSSGNVNTLNQDTTGSSKALLGILPNNVVSAPGTNKINYSGQVSSGVIGLFPATNNANSFLTLNKHSGRYDSQLGFSSNGNVYYRSFNGSALNTTTAWKTMAFTDSNITGTAAGLSTTLAVASGGTGAANLNAFGLLAGTQTFTGTNTFTGTLTGTPANANIHSLKLGRTDTSNYWYVNHAGSDFRLYNDAGSGSNILFGVNSNGDVKANNVGIGTATPAEKLDVAGNVAISGNITSAGWTGDVITSAYLDTDTAHLSGAQTFTGTKTLNSFKGTGGATVTNILDEDAMGSDSPTALATQQSIKAYVDSPQGGKSYRIINASFRDDISTTKHYLPLKTEREDTVLTRAENNELAVTDGRVVSVTLRVENLNTHTGDAVVTFGVETNVAGVSYNSWTIPETEALTIAHTDDQHVFHYVFDDTKHWDSTDMWAISIQSDVVMSGTNERFFVTVVVEDDWSTYLAGSSREINTTP